LRRAGIAGWQARDQRRLAIGRAVDVADEAGSDGPIEARRQAQRAGQLGRRRRHVALGEQQQADPGRPEGLAPGLGCQRRRGRLGQRQARGKRLEGGGEVGHAGQMGMIRRKARGA
jgi:hypothetical protein